MELYFGLKSYKKIFFQTAKLYFKVKYDLEKAPLKSSFVQIRRTTKQSRTTSQLKNRAQNEKSVTKTTSWGGTVMEFCIFLEIWVSIILYLTLAYQIIDFSINKCPIIQIRQASSINSSKIKF